MIEEACGKDCTYNPIEVNKAISMHHCPLCGHMQIAGISHTCCCFKCYNEIVDLYC